VGSKRNHKNRKTDNQKVIEEPGLYKQIWLPGLDNVDNRSTKYVELHGKQDAGQAELEL
jgi:hypothetical protein